MGCGEMPGRGQSPFGGLTRCFLSRGQNLSGYLSSTIDTRRGRIVSDDSPAQVAIYSERNKGVLIRSRIRRQQEQYGNSAQGYPKWNRVNRWHFPKLFEYLRDASTNAPTSFMSRGKRMVDVGRMPEHPNDMYNTLPVAMRGASKFIGSRENIFAAPRRKKCADLNPPTRVRKNQLRMPTRARDGILARRKSAPRARWQTPKPKRLACR